MPNLCHHLATFENTMRCGFRLCALKASPTTRVAAFDAEESSQPRSRHAFSRRQGGDRRKSARRRDAGYRLRAAQTPGVRLKIGRAIFAHQTEVNGRRQTAPAQHQKGGKGLLQADGAEWHVPGGASNGATDEFRLRRRHAPGADFAPDDAEKLERAL